MHSVAVKLPRLDAAHEHVPVMVGTVSPRGRAESTRAGLDIIFPVKQQQLNAGRVAGKYAEIDAIQTVLLLPKDSSARCWMTLPCTL